MNILMINIDMSYRSLYSESVAKSLAALHPLAKCTLITAKGNEALDATGSFSQIHYIDVDRFFQDTRESSSDSLEREIKRLLTSVINSEWDLVVNLSSNSFGMLLTHFLNYKKIQGTYLEEETNTIKYTNLSAYLLASVPDEVNCYLHFTYLFRNIIDGSHPFPKYVSSNAEVIEKFAGLTSQAGKKGILLIDSRIKKSGNLSSFNFLIELFQRINKEGRWLPMLLSNHEDEESFLVTRLRDALEGELHLVNSLKSAHLDLISNVSLLITDDLYLKAAADLSQVPSLLLCDGGELPLSDFSTTEKSMLVRFKHYDLGVVDWVLGLSRQVLEGLKYKPVDIGDVEVYETYVHNSIPLVRPLYETSDEFCKWYLILRYLAFSQSLELPSINLDTKNYLSVIEHERGQIRSGFNKRIALMKEEGLNVPVKNTMYESSEDGVGILDVGMHLVKFRNNLVTEVNSKKYLEQMKVLLQELQDFLVKEEATYGKS